MSGVRFICRISTADITDDFNRADRADLSGVATPVGQIAWERFRAVGSTATAGIVSNRFRATAGDDNVAYLLNAGATDYDVTYTIRDARNLSIVPSVVFRGINDESHFMLAHRYNPTDPRYCIFNRVTGTLSLVASSSVIPVPGDRVRIRVRGLQVTVFVNDQQIIDSTMSGGADRIMCGVLMSGADQVSSLDNFSIYRR